MSLRLVLAIAASSLFAGCFSVQTPTYRKVDQDDPAFKTAVAQKTEALRAEGKSSATAERLATREVTKQVVQTKKQTQIERVAPLREAIAAFDRAAGCWAYTLTTTTRQSGATSVTVETYDPFQPEARIWTLVSRDGQPPNDETQADYRADKLREWRRGLKPPRRTASERAQFLALFAQADVSFDDNGAATRFSFERTSQTSSLIDAAGLLHETYTIAPRTRTLAQHQLVVSQPTSMAKGAFKIDHALRSTDYVLLEPSLPPFPAKVIRRERLHVLGIDRGEVDQEIVYSNYRRVKCFDDRFEVKVGIPSVQEAFSAESR